MVFNITIFHITVRKMDLWTFYLYIIGIHENLQSYLNKVVLKKNKIKYLFIILNYYYYNYYYIVYIFI